MAQPETALSELERATLAYFTAVTANDIVIAGRFYPRSEISLIIEDKVAIATRKFGPRVRATAKAAGGAFVELMLEKGGWSTKQNDFGGTMHQFQPDVYKASLLDMQANDPIVQASQGQGPEFWADKFAALTTS
jgi:hypothetical protein